MDKKIFQIKKIFNNFYIHCIMCYPICMTIDYDNVVCVPNKLLYKGLKKKLKKKKMNKSICYLNEIFERLGKNNKYNKLILIDIISVKMNSDMRQKIFKIFIKKINFNTFADMYGKSIMKTLILEKCYDIDLYKILILNNYDINKRYMKYSHICCTDLCFLHSQISDIPHFSHFSHLVNIGDLSLIKLKYFLIKNGAEKRHKTSFFK
jgi:hypothetical protein